MLRLLKKPLIILIICCLFLAIPSKALAFPPFPSSIYGIVLVNGKNVADGTLIEALINGIVFATAYTQMYEGESVFSLDIPGDEAGTTPVEGGKEGETIHFKIGGIIAKETGTWHSGTNVRLNLSATSSNPVSTPPKAPTPLPTQTEMVFLPTATNQPTLEGSEAGLPAPMPMIELDSPRTSTATEPPLSTSIVPEVTGVSILTPTEVTMDEAQREKSLFGVGILIILGLITALVVFLVKPWKKRSK